MNRSLNPPPVKLVTEKNLFSILPPLSSQLHTETVLRKHLIYLEILDIQVKSGDLWKFETTKPYNKVTAPPS